MVKWTTITLVSMVAYFVPVKYIIKVLIDYYKTKPISMKKRTAIIVMDNIGMNFERAREYAKQNCKLIVISTNTDKANKAAKELTKITKNKKISVVQVNCKNRDELKLFAHRISTTESSVDILVNNDGFEIVDMEIVFSNQELALERLETHFCNFMHEADGRKSAELV